MELTFNLKEVITIGVGFFSIGGLFVWSIVHSKGISALWSHKLDCDVFKATMTPMQVSITEIEGDVKEILRINGGPR